MTKYCFSNTTQVLNVSRPTGFCSLFPRRKNAWYFSPRCLCLDSQKRLRESRGERDDVVDYLSVIIKRRMTIKMQLKIGIQVLLWLWSGQVLHDVVAGRSQTSQMTGSPMSDANLLFEILLGGVEIDRDNNILLHDKEMASMRPGRAFLSQINDNIPRDLSSMVQAVTTQEGQRRRPLTQTQFENLVLSMVYSAYQARRQEGEEEQAAWSGVLLQLANITVHELRGSYLFNYT
ncbi:family with sequence similarity 180 member B [Scophthalmus maximus]|nr:family with sequence similarity 180 member B [Scophthalmus maximus]